MPEYRIDLRSNTIIWIYKRILIWQKYRTNLTGFTQKRRLKHLWNCVPVFGMWSDCLQQCISRIFVLKNIPDFTIHIGKLFWFMFSENIRITFKLSNDSQKRIFVYETALVYSCTFSLKQTVGEAKRNVNVLYMVILIHDVSHSVMVALYNY